MEDLKFCHKVHGKYYWASEQITTKVQYEVFLKEAYGSLHNVKIYEKGVDFDKVGLCCGKWFPLIHGQYIL